MCRKIYKKIQKIPSNGILFGGNAATFRRLSVNFLTIWEKIWDQNSISMTHIYTLKYQSDTPWVSNIISQFNLF